MKYLIQPLNEGQDLNYTEIKEFSTKEKVRIYCKKMARILKEALPKGEISVEYEEYDAD